MLCVPSNACRSFVRLSAAILMAIVCLQGPVWADREDPKAAESSAESSKDESEPADDDYYELFELLADTFDQIDRNYVKEVNRRELVEAAIRGMLSELDPYSAYIEPKKLDRFRTGVESEFGGVGIQVSIEDGVLRVISPIVGSPAYRSGMLAGDVITEIEGKSAKGITIDEAVALMKGKPGTEVAVKVLHPGAEEPEAITLTREIVRVETVLGDRRKEDASWNWFLDEDRKIGYIRLTAVGRPTADELREALKQLTDQDVKALILDLRFNPGGLLSSAIEVSDMFISEGRIVSTEGRNTPTRTWDAKEKGTLGEFPMVVLVNRYSASASEIVAACLQDHERAVIVGERSWGKGSVQNVVELEDGASALKLTTADYRRPSGKNIHRFKDAEDEDDWGVMPNEGFEVKLTIEETGKLTTQRRQKDIVRRPGDKPVDGEGADDLFVDPQLEKALAYIDQQLQESSDPPELETVEITQSQADARN
jgi:carboxyl-terminal processing protease